MPARPLPSRRPTRLRSVTGRLALAGAAGLAALAAAAPAASALDDGEPEGTQPAAPEVTPAPEPEAAEPDVVQPDAVHPESAQPEVAAPAAVDGDEAPAAAPALAPDFGFQKYRVGVRLADGSYVPEGTTTAGTTFTVTETNRDGDTFTFTCTTSAETTTADGSTYCLTDEADYPDEEASEELADGPVAQAVVEPGVEIDPEDVPDDGQAFVLQPGSSVSVLLTAAPPNLRGVTTSATVAPCIRTTDPVVCLNGDQSPQASAITFSLVGLPPVAVDDTARTRVDVPVDIALLPNDDTVLGAPLTDLVIASGPSNGTATLVGNVARYTPARGFTGTDTFTYTISTPNGTATATVRIVVEGGSIVRSSTRLPNTGGPDATLLGIGALLLGGGTWVAARGRRDARGARATV
ncbi:Ig-like domain-containing protein [Aeromicrobium sp. Sec7.5]|uniref:Ig-like domain-containing protein n=1 Tax=Aeromicrobium sp. Sec7.5 TaxID=3121276 RepID=UPI002FE46453